MMTTTADTNFPRSMLNEWKVDSEANELSVYIIACNREHAAEIAEVKHNNFFPSGSTKVSQISLYTHGARLRGTTSCAWCGRKNRE